MSGMESCPWTGNENMHSFQTQFLSYVFRLTLEYRAQLPNEDI